ncbi:nucleotidyl transferase AbiEii/AbiGii toxin family protein [Rhodoferax mekongensis]|uniref:Nucleotidyl transferase AbiEii/AbiGii toxin family protein n=1 Tax=Rhodoferax mekongensis TaxID=3068341 RepID=A0ABZ0AWB4_9BURK|nr:nucleotidyl transferase AbiEii/AbiGii toxin family protein [Rhodoferax sp. TBRC 17307]WNO03937.1 nucleotidyl transferase AbiEii/AbiGii toxin family protein [Rhodoferax sp. TBRC 17307]
MNQAYVSTVRLLLEIAPAIFETPFFAMKGGTALNLFVQDLPRLSVDIDVVFVPHDMQRDDALKTIKDELAAAKTRIERIGLAAEIRQNKVGDEAKMFVTDYTSEVKVEVNFVFRGTVHAPVRSSLTAAAQTLFTANIEVPILAVPELYGSKLVAAMDRQHPRDLFDVQHMFDRFGLPPEFVDCFVVYLAGHNRPVHEVLFAKPQPLAEVFKNEFIGMPTNTVTLEQLEATRVQLFELLPKALTPAHRTFLLSLVQADPDWSQMPYEHLLNLPAIRWKLMNLAKLKKSNPQRFEQQHDDLAARLAAVV